MNASAFVRLARSEGCSWVFIVSALVIYYSGCVIGICMALKALMYLIRVARGEA